MHHHTRQSLMLLLETCFPTMAVSAWSQSRGDDVKEEKEWCYGQDSLFLEIISLPISDDSLLVLVRLMKSSLQFFFLALVGLGRLCFSGTLTLRNRLLHPLNPSHMRLPVLSRINQILTKPFHDIHQSER